MITRFAVLFFVLAAATFVSGALAFDLTGAPKYDRSYVTGEAETAEMKGFQVMSSSTGIVFTRNQLFRTRDGGVSWSEIEFGKESFERIAQVHLDNNTTGWILLTDTRKSRLEMLQTNDGGMSWDRRPLAIEPGELSDAVLEDAGLTKTSLSEWQLTIPVQTSSNFKGTVRFVSSDGLQRWRARGRYVEMNVAEDPSPVISSGGWTLKTEGNCLGAKSGCFQETKLFRGNAEITPPMVKELAGAIREKATASATLQFALPPGGNTRTSLNRGFDKCQAGSIAQMQIWWNQSPLYDTNIYMSGRNRACPSQPFTNNPAWIDQVSAMGWGLIPTIVGYQSPCTSSATTAKLDYNVVTAETQGRGEADIAVADAVSIGLTAGSVLYYDMERYDPPSPDTLGCRAATVAFLKGWTDRVKELGYKSGVYGSPKNAQEDWVGLPQASKMDAIWMARWDNIPSVWTYLTFPNFPTGEWANHQRIKQWQAPHNETWGGVTFNIDGNNADGPVAGITIPKNKNADFDGDGKSDISVFRPDDGIWYVFLSSNMTLSVAGFGNAADIIAPGDFDGDGKTDYSIFRPADGVWHMLTKSGAYSARQFGATGDIPVAGDFNGDKKTDIAVFRPSNGVWYIANSDSLGTITILQFGQAGDKPVPADYDGDGRADLAVYRPSNGVWYILRSSDFGFYGVGFGIETDLPAQGDYDGDGKADQAVYRDGVWYLQQSTSGFAAVPFGLAGDVPSTGDFDGDGKDDVAVFRPSLGAWYLLQSQAGFLGIGFGQAGDRPVEAAYLPQ